MKFWMSDRKRSSASSFSSMVAPAIRTMKKRTNAPMMAKVLALAGERREGNHSLVMQICPMAIPTRLHRAVTRQTLDPSWATFSRARKA